MIRIWWMPQNSESWSFQKLDSSYGYASAVVKARQIVKSIQSNPKYPVFMQYGVKWFSEDDTGNTWHRFTNIEQKTVAEHSIPEAIRLSLLLIEDH